MRGVAARADRRHDKSLLKEPLAVDRVGVVVQDIILVISLVTDTGVPSRWHCPQSRGISMMEIGEPVTDAGSMS